MRRAFAYAESQVANIRVRNQGTLGGNLAFNDPHSDPGTVLLVHNASVTIGNAKGERRLALDDFFVDMYATALEAGELLLEVEIPSLPAGMTSAYLRLHRYQRPTLGVAVAVRIDNDNDCRGAIGRGLRRTEGAAVDGVGGEDSRRDADGCKKDIC